MSLRLFKIFTIFVPVIIIGGFEYIRHEFLLNYLTMEAGNFSITIITLLLSYLFASWMFQSIERSNEKVTIGEARRAVYEERERLARELHDDLAQTLFFLNVKLKQGDLEEAKAAVSEIDNSLRQAIFNLRTPLEEGTSLEQRIHKFLKDWHLVTGIELQEKLIIEERSFSSGEEVQLFSIIQEAFTNIRKHSKATEAAILLEAHPKAWQLHITDNGCGLHNLQGKGKKYGIELMQKRAAELGATFEFKMREVGEFGSGTSLLVQADRRSL
ncbi:two-component system, NarL family, nitrate/nitrite sensor histidine kinase NarX [Paenibacillus sp. yr247]|uniref:sensor histidine kinase n=1 Tax=Paenibacillus sp. yr247 TaxID=1761880 RepID=UPI00088EA0D2|nr:histidine kinase [Paenibacillus sp. yr247]SDN28949.1 two-component system, NarL family, nitrate/nitrite sensor histidine kinase NarX [Paenibacillus sp. yr247]